MVWRRKNEELNPKNLVGTVKYGGGGVLVWGCMSASGLDWPAVLNQYERHFGTGLAGFNHGQMTRKVSELTAPLQASLPHQKEDVYPHTYDLTCNTADLQWNRVSSLKHLAPKPRPYH
ncbi:hypothetical protein AVEN_131104-1 [Araneus ventricosus]|uniref:Uncharacterized protein n=1 Tax=Araneus ventricosus TaxID=182803 RepID=A0A4Y2GJ69_ARAVE|nr:hypothetical protein AVEN_131104-1 [Araneus ventricosus]